MPQATYEADFSEFVAECAKAVEGLKAMTAQAEQTTAALAKMGETKPATAAIDKAKELNKELGKTPDAIGTIGKAAGALGIGVTLAGATTAVVNFWKESIHAADAIKNIADQTGMTATQVQKLETVAEGAGLKIEDLAKASATLQKSMLTDEGITAIGRLGIDAERLKAANPYDQLVMVAKGLGTVEDRGERLRLQQDLLGANSSKLARVMNESFEETANAATTASDSAVAAVAGLEAKYNEAKATLKAYAIEGLGGVLEAAKGIKDFPWSETWRAVSASDSMPEFIANMRLIREQLDAVNAMKNAPRPWMDDPSTWGGGPTREQLAEAAAARKKLEAEQNAEWEAWEKRESARVAKVQEAQAEINEARKGSIQVLGTLTSAERKAAEEALQFGISQDKVATALGLTIPQVKAVADEIERGKKAIEGLKEANETYAELAAEHFESVTAASATSTQQQILAIGTWRAKAMADLAATGQASNEMYEGVARMAEEKLAAVGIDFETLRAGSIKTFEEQYQSAERTYQAMRTSSNTYTEGAIENARKERDARLLAFEQAKGAGNAMYAEWMAREAQFAAAIAGHDKARAESAGAAADANSAAMDEAIAYAQAYGVSLAEAQKALGQLPPEAAKVTGETGRAADAAGRLTVQMQQFGTAAMTAYESAIAGAKLLQAYADAGIATSHAIGMGGYEFDQLKKTGVPGGWGGVQWANRTPTPEGAWGTGQGATSTTNTLNVNVSGTGAQDIANKIVTEMRHQGVRL